MVATAKAACAANLYNKPGVLPFLSLCSRYPGSPWAGLLQQTIKEKQANISFGIQRLVNDNSIEQDMSASEAEDVESKSNSSAFSPWQSSSDHRSIEKVANDTCIIDETPEEEDDDDINVDDDDEDIDQDNNDVIPNLTTKMIHNNNNNANTTTSMPKKTPSIFSVSSLLSNDSPTSRKNSSASPLQSNPVESATAPREKDEITPDHFLPNMRPFLYPGLTLDMLTKRTAAAAASTDLFPRNLANPFTTFGSLFPGKFS